MCRAEKPTAPALPVIKGVIFLGHKREDWQRGLLKTALIGCSLCAWKGGRMVGGRGGVGRDADSRSCSYRLSIFSTCVLVAASGRRY